MTNYKKPTPDEGDEILKWCHYYVTYVLIADPPNSQSSVVHHNATCLFLDTGSCQFGVTNQHVLDRYRIMKEENSNINFQVNMLIFDIENRIIDESRERDLVTFEISTEDLEEIKKTFCFCRRWPPERAVAGETIVFLGYPGQFREQISVGRINIEYVRILEIVKSSSENQFVVFLDKEKWVKRLGKRDIDELESLGGISGAAVYRIIEIKGIATIEPLGIIFEGSEEWNLQLVRHIDFINRDGTIKHQFG